MADTFCILPWNNLTVLQGGEVGICHAFRNVLRTDDGTPLSAETHTLDEIWNSTHLRRIRSDMVAGKEVAGCEACYWQEVRGNPSVRLGTNEQWENGWLNSKRLTLDEFKTEAARGKAYSTGPGFVQLNVGNRCNLKCRMCGGNASSRISRDPVHGKWAPASMNHADERLFGRQMKLLAEILRHPENLDTLSLMGGEPLITKEIGDVLQLIIDAGVAERVTLWITTNATTARVPWLDLVERFRLVKLFVSIDGTHELFEYLRHPARWSTLLTNIDLLRKIPNARLTAAVAVQAYNALGIVDLFRFLDELELPFAANSIFAPVHLTTRVLPPRARQLAAERLLAYHENGCKLEHQEVVKMLAMGLVSLGEEWNKEHLLEFMTFTNDLDISRGESFAKTCQELSHLIAETGTTWPPQTRFAC